MYRTPDPSAKKSKEPVKHVFDITVYMTSGASLSFQMPNPTHYTDLKLQLRAIHELFVEKWDVEDFWAWKKIQLRDNGVVVFRRGSIEHIINLKHVEYYKVEPVQISGT